MNKLAWWVLVGVCVVTGCASSPTARPCWTLNDGTDDYECTCDVHGTWGAGGAPSVSTCSESFATGASCCQNAATDVCTCLRPAQCHAYGDGTCSCGEPAHFGDSSLTFTTPSSCSPPSGTRCCFDPSVNECSCLGFTTCGSSEMTVSSCTSAMLDGCGSGTTAVQSCEPRS